MLPTLKEIYELWKADKYSFWFLTFVIVGAVYLMGKSGGWWQDEKLAAWVQAVGSVVAIIASVALMMWQHKLEVQSAKDATATDREEFFAAVAAYVREAVNVADDALNLFVNDHVDESLQQRCAQAIESIAFVRTALEEVPAYSLREMPLTSGILTIRKSLYTCCDILEGYASGEIGCRRSRALFAREHSLISATEIMFISVATN